MKKYIAPILLSLCCMTHPVLAAASLCAPTEKIFFSCATGEKIISVCASSDYPSPSASLQYRFGSKLSTEMAWPEPATLRAGVTFGNIAYSGGGLGYIRFAKDDLEYVVYSGMGRGWEKEGVMVEKNGKRVGNHLCKGAAAQDLWHTNLPEDANDIENAMGDKIP